MSEISLGNIGKIAFKAKLPARSAVTDFKGRTPLPYGHIIIVPEDEEIEWQELPGFGVRAGDLVNLGETELPKILAHFLPELTPDNAAYRFELNSPKAAALPTVHLHMLLGHRELFGKNGLFRRCVDSALRST